MADSKEAKEQQAVKDHLKAVENARLARVRARDERDSGKKGK